MTIQRTTFIFLLTIALFSCKKLDSEQIFLKTACPECKEVVEDKVAGIEGVHYVNYDIENETLTFHFEKTKSRVEAEAWLMSNGYMQSPDTTLHIIPACCPKKDTLSNG